MGSSTGKKLTKNNKDKSKEKGEKLVAK